MIKWEYLTIECDHTGEAVLARLGGVKTENMDGIVMASLRMPWHLDLLGRDGWECCSSVSAPSGSWIWVFKRRIE